MISLVARILAGGKPVVTPASTLEAYGLNDSAERILASGERTFAQFQAFVIATLPPLDACDTGYRSSESSARTVRVAA